MSNWYVYMVRCADDSLYTGITTDPNRRVKEHNGIGAKGARYTRSRRPVTLVWYESVSDRSTAASREYQLKQLTRAAKLKLLSNFSSAFA